MEPINQARLTQPWHNTMQAPDNLGSAGGGEAGVMDQSSSDAPAGGSATGGLDSVAAERDKYLEMAKRTRAEFENYQKRIARDREEDRKFAAVPLVTDLLPVIDNLDRALQSAKDPNEGIVVGVQMVRKQLIDTLGRYGVEPIQPKDGEEPFDPNLHQAIMQQPAPGKPPMIVLHTTQAGYKMHDRVIRPAQVIVSATGEEADGGAG